MPPAPTLTAPAPAVPAAIAALPEVKAAGGSPEYKPMPALSRTEMTRTIQLELYRVGCGSNEANGNWTPATREGLRKFNKFMHAKLDLSDPSSGTIATLQNRAAACARWSAAGASSRGATPASLWQSQSPNPAPNLAGRSVASWNAGGLRAAPLSQPHPPPLSRRPLVFRPASDDALHVHGWIWFRRH